MEKEEIAYISPFVTMLASLFKDTRLTTQFLISRNVFRYAKNKHTLDEILNNFLQNYKMYV